MSLAGARGTGEAAQRLARLLSDAPADAPRLAPLPEGRAPAQVAAVDGSHVVLAEAGDVVLAAHRAGWVGLSRGQPVHMGPEPPEVVLLTPESGRALLLERLAAAGARGADPPRMDPGATLDALRTLGEMACALDALEALHEGDLLLLDGPLQARPAVPLMDRLVARAKERRVDLVGVCKSTSLTVGPVPALAACQLAGRRLREKTWWAELAPPPSLRGRCLAARLSPAEERVFRFDVSAHDDDAPRVLAGVATLAGHPAYPGYPSPLAMAHNAVLLTEETRQRLRAEVQEAAMRAGVREGAWEAAFLDYHDLLELGA